MKKLLCIILLALCKYSHAQIPVEFFSGDKRATVDVMFFKFLKNKNEENTKLLFFNRTRASVDYRMTTKNYLPLFGFTQAISYNHEKLKGFAPVMVGQVLSNGVFAKAGIQYAHIQKSFTVFSWLVSECSTQPDFDYFLLLRYTPVINKNWNLFVQGESISSLPTRSTETAVYTQRLRVGLQRHKYQFGIGSDFTQYSNKLIKPLTNFGGFLRHEF